MAKIKSKNRLKPELPRGFTDIQGSILEIRDEIIRHMREVSALYGYELIETPLVENLDALGSFLPDEDRPRQGVFAFNDDDERWLALRYDLTAPLARFTASNRNNLVKPYRSYRAGTVLRNEKPGPGRFRQFMQSDIDVLWSPCPQGDAEICEIAFRVFDRLHKFGIDFSLHINHRQVLNALITKLNLDANNDADINRNGIIMRALDKLDRIGLDGVRELLGKGRMDVSGDFSKGAGLSQVEVDEFCQFLAARGENNQQTINNLREIVGVSSVGSQAIDELEYIDESIAKSDLSDAKLVIDPAIVRGLGYYTGPIFEAIATKKNDTNIANSETKPEKEPVNNFGAVGGGGRYDTLVQRFGGEPVPACGFSIGASRLAALINELSDLTNHHSKNSLKVVVLALDDEAHNNCDNICNKLRAKGISTAKYLGSSGMRAQLRFADKSGAQFAIMEGEKERDEGVMAVKDLHLGASMAGSIENRDKWIEHSQQRDVPFDEIIDYIVERL